ncbi:hypothetical protein PR202_ga00017 [Eleusine coracana subsp. coracana]|uniref:Uncharacterized protein n=1 Tax=Eleusine coracana subsp. coracana TaxID=191504 RepID=A0AAV5BDD0_ELECO|nr:hypothetical protein PR202_ga00017 [Eleusine coracana subsp. coracana]
MTPSPLSRDALFCLLLPVPSQAAVAAGRPDPVMESPDPMMGDRIWPRDCRIQARRQQVASRVVASDALLYIFLPIPSRVAAAAGRPDPVMESPDPMMGRSELAPGLPDPGRTVAGGGERRPCGWRPAPLSLSRPPTDPAGRAVRGGPAREETADQAAGRRA